ncbi:Aerobic respiration control sensor protein ArcB [Sedimentisphaera cyanobacteriorum]|uniref:histidine kinase n=1 Tax=Sedimentisphaera cyanobacteriorum TaxID=1940790 RepID=A0A1Q2HSL1_9BACT|nr:PhnD/SsuA/transferrin family substrate-binding protein [Sedimentisphaera cyanobacteriorum]AQQ10457.1 Aerobic respiration control sensor protein ArcB [Sedimentisphaera cyanobacteriorum]
MRKSANLLLVLALFLTTALEAEDYNIGVLAKRGDAKCLERWSATGGYLSDQFESDTFGIVPLDFNEIEEAVKNRQVDFVLANPAVYVNLEYNYHIKRIATLVNKGRSGNTTRFAGTVFCLRDKSFSGFQDLKGLHIAAVDRNSFGGWLAVKYELLKAGLDVPGDFNSLSFAGSHDKVVYSVQHGSADAGIVRSNSLERLAAEGRINFDDFRIIGERRGRDIPFLYSTETYPEWPFSSLSYIPGDVCKRVATALYSMPEGHNAANQASIAGWTVPCRYKEVRECLKDIKYTPYQMHGKVTLGQVFLNYKNSIYFILLSVLILGLVLVWLVLLNRKLHLSTAAKENEIKARKEAEKQLKEANKAKERFLANMSHEIRTPMNSIIGFCDLLREFDFPKEARSYVEKISISGGSLLELINDILDFSKIEAGRMKVDLNEFSLGRLLNNVESIIYQKVKEKKLEFGIIENGALPANIVSDQHRLNQCLINLCSNAVKFTNSGHVNIIVSTFRKNGEDWISFAIEDTGVGISEDKLDHIFDPFTQAEESTARKYGGTGLGLSVTSKLAGLLGGELKCSSEPGLGSTFTLSVPAGLDVNSQARMDRLNLREASYENHQQLTNQFSGNILVAEDSPTNQMLIRIYLEKMGLNVDVAENGQLAVDMAMKKSYRLIFMDVQMPEMDGCEAAQRLRKQNWNGPIIALTANAMKGDREKCLAAGCDYYLSKPIDRIKLISALEQYLRDEDFQESKAGKAQIEDNAGLIKRFVKKCGDEDMAKQLAAVFLEDGYLCLEKIKQALKDNNQKDLELYSHRLKSSARHVAAERLSQICLELELHGRNSEIEKARSLLPELESLYAEISDTFREFLK